MLVLRRSSKDQTQPHFIKNARKMLQNSQGAAPKQLKQRVLRLAAGRSFTQLPPFENPFIIKNMRSMIKNMRSMRFRILPVTLALTAVAWAGIVDEVRADLAQNNFPAAE